ncbi:MULTISPECIES: DNA damage-induced cell division inhibitor SosA [Staphylococcus]|jgi:hypothetical protein|uniref:Secreted protein n=1 Tax=Staphylococcus lugdunensis TaxID=28035 RepID=A0ABD4EER8_STALU|nr:MULTISPECIES: DNA damage-induced cell division inhibitor SosA [Staphylococcus]ADC87649.1 hypothetical protein SLGD_01558 [Staphylococcus lugdunensis HKU09-01]AMG63036.1 hypothetical protein AL501_01725 [Staphylococcus lugdunensis]ARB77891.1 hypothetical protein A6J61_06130 [Staphylococcus lugdunensis]ARJ09411.1 hypothetical protein B7454_08465 [Staphylococcus lugdunensis]ARJ14107.1 hypothetical protein B7468_07215 [Staphylococcus lugdunensis]
MILKYKSQIATYIIVFIISLLVFSLFFTTAYQNSKVEQTYEMADHNISQHYKINSESKQQSISNSEQNHTSVFAYAK